MDVDPRAEVALTSKPGDSSGVEPEDRLEPSCTEA
jgi:hypothetical protein